MKQKISYLALASLILFSSIIISSCKKKDNELTSQGKIDFPNGGEMLWKGTEYKISWTDESNKPMNIELYKDDVKLTSIEENMVSNFDWLIPQDLEQGYHYKIVIRQADGNIYAISSDNFIIIDPPETSSFTDTRDGQTYKTVKIGNQWWLAQNFNYETDEGSMCYLDVPKNCTQKGKLYTYEAAVASVPDGWRLPSDKDWQILEMYLGMPEHVAKQEGKRGKYQGYMLWKGGGSGFEALLSGYYNSRFGLFGHIEYETRFWSSTPVNGTG